MNTVSMHAAARIAALWRSVLQVYGEPQVRSTLVERWPHDQNLTQGRIQFSFPPTFQPGYVGPEYFDGNARIVFLGYNPGEGRQASSQSGDLVLGRWLKRFEEGNETFSCLQDFQAAHLVGWPIYRGKGIFRETDDAAIALLPAHCRPSVRSVALLNLFPLKTVSNKKPLAGRGGPCTSLKVYMWESLLKPTLELLAPKAIVYYPDADSYLNNLAALPSQPKLVRAWHPSDYNLTAQRDGLAQSWQLLAAALAGRPTLPSSGQPPARRRLPLKPSVMRRKKPRRFMTGDKRHTAR